jgi:hypothetical protein
MASISLRRYRLGRADTCIGATGGVVKEYLRTDGCIAEGDGVVKERAIADGRVVLASGVIKERVNAIGRVRAAGSVVTERSKTGCCVGAAGSVVKKGEHSTGRVVVRQCWQEAPGADRRVEVTGEVALERKPTNAVLYVPAVRLRRGFCPSAVLPPG